MISCFLVWKCILFHLLRWWCCRLTASFCATCSVCIIKGLCCNRRMMGNDLVFLILLYQNIIWQYQLEKVNAKWSVQHDENVDAVDMKTYRKQQTNHDYSNQNSIWCNIDKSGAENICVTFILTLLQNLLIIINNIKDWEKVESNIEHTTECEQSFDHRGKISRS